MPAAVPGVGVAPALGATEADGIGSRSVQGGVGLGEPPGVDGHGQARTGRRAHEGPRLGRGARGNRKDAHEPQVGCAVGLEAPPGPRMRQRPQV